MTHSYFSPLRGLLTSLLLLLLAWPAAPLQAQVLARTFAAGSTHSLSIHADGTLWAWGDNYYGQLGIPASKAYTTTWVQVGAASNWVQVAAGSTHSLGLRADGTLWAWGGNESGQLGSSTNNGTGNANSTPTQVAGTYTQIAAGGAHSLGLRADGTLWAWGSNGQGQLGSPIISGVYGPNPTPTQVTGTYTQIAAGGAHSLGLRADGSLYAWGSNQYGQLGTAINNGTTRANPPTQVAGTYAQVAAGADHSLGLRADGSLYAWGYNAFGQLGSPTNSGTVNANPTPTPVAGTYTQVAAGYYHSVGLRADGSLYAWGNNQYGQLGNPANNGTNSANYTPTQVAGTYAQVAAGGSQCLGLRANGDIYAWGYIYNGQLGSAPASANPTPTALGTALVTRSLAMGLNFGLAVKGDGTLWAWGDNTYGQLGLPTTLASTTRPVQVGTATDWVMVAAGEQHSLGLRADGSLYAWGNNYYGQLGSGTTYATPTPTQVAGTYTKVAAGQYFSLGLRATGSLYTWGRNDYGQLGNGTTSTTATPTPTQVAGTYVQVAAGQNHGLALRADGSLWAWGYNYNGQLGNATNNGAAAANPTPTQVGGTYTQVAAAGQHSLGLRADGSLYAWGYNFYGQLGSATNSGTGTANPLPTQVGTATDWVQVAAGVNHSLALKADGSLYAWGRNHVGQLGSGRTGSTANFTPTQEATLGTSWTTLGTGSVANFSLVRTPSAQNFASAGQNNSGQLGDGTSDPAVRFDRTSPLTSLQPLPVRPVVPAGAGLSLYPNPASGRAILSGAVPGAAVQVLDALGRLVGTATADASGSATLTLPGGLPGGVYVVRAGQCARRLTVE